MTLKLKSWRETLKSTSINTLLIGGALTGAEMMRTDATLMETVSNFHTYAPLAVIALISMYHDHVYRYGQWDGYQQAKKE